MGAGKTAGSLKEIALKTQEDRGVNEHNEQRHKSGIL